MQKKMDRNEKLWNEIYYCDNLILKEMSAVETWL